MNERKRTGRGTSVPAKGQAGLRAQGERAAASPSIRRARKPTRAALESRVRELEDRLNELERHVVDGTKPTPKVSKPLAAAPDAPRCPGCHLPVESVLEGHCSWCGFLFDVVADLRRAAEGKVR